MNRLWPILLALAISCGIARAAFHPVTNVWVEYPTNTWPDGVLTVIISDDGGETTQAILATNFTSVVSLFGVAFLPSNQLFRGVNTFSNALNATGLTSLDGNAELLADGSLTWDKVDGKGLVITQTQSGLNLQVLIGMEGSAAAGIGSILGIAAGDATNASVAGNLLLDAGDNDSSGDGGDVSVRAGDAATAAGGDVILISGDGGTDTSRVEIRSETNVLIRNQAGSTFQSVESGSHLPGTSNTFTMGDANRPWAELFVNALGQDVDLQDNTLSGGFFAGDGSALTGLVVTHPAGIAFLDSNQVFSGANVFSNTVTSGDLLPLTPNNYNVGTTNTVWANVFLGTNADISFQNGSAISQSGTEILTISGAGSQSGTEGTIQLLAGDAGGTNQGAALFFQSGGSLTGPAGDVDILGGDTLTGAGGSITLRSGFGTSGDSQVTIQSQTNLLIRNEINSAWQTIESGDSVPGADNTYSLGTPGLAWQSVYVNALSTDIDAAGNTISNGFFLGDGVGLTNLVFAGAEADPVHTNWLATNTFVQTETDPLWTSASNLYYLQTEADALFATGTPLYVFTETDAIFTNWLGTNTYVQTEADSVFTNWLATNQGPAYANIYFTGTNTGPALTATYAALTNLVDGVFSGCSVSGVLGRVTIAPAGTYKVNFTLSFAGTANEDVELSVRENGVQLDQLVMERKLGTGGDVGSAGLAGLVALTNGAVLDTAARAIDGSGSFTLISHQLMVERIDD